MTTNDELAGRMARPKCRGGWPARDACGECEACLGEVMRSVLPGKPLVVPKPPVAAPRRGGDPLPFNDLDTIAANSFSNFHAKGLDYLCLLRSPMLTLKAYFYDNPHAPCPEVVCPHDHRYPFSTTILAGRSEHLRYRMPGQGTPRTKWQLCQAFAWDTPLNGGTGFKHLGETHLGLDQREQYRTGETYWCEADEVHTIAISTAGTILLLAQHADVVPIGKPTTTFVPGDNREPPALTGLYERMPLRRAEQLLNIVKGLLNG